MPSASFGIHPPIPGVAITYGIGFGNAGGDWRLVENVIIQWGEGDRETGCDILLVRLMALAT
ncbi:hypothetical protein FRC02_002709 [Tulasnella sp. 418]|nr:hypothetical protein FRC02_002709 [Tulasnella sp. 418]